MIRRGVPLLALFVTLATLALCVPLWCEFARATAALQFVERELRARGYISPEDVNLVTITDDVFREPRRHTHCTVDAPPLDQVGSDLPGHTAESVHRGDVPHGGLGSPAPE